MSERLTYTSGALAGALDEEFERCLEQQRATAQAPFAHLIAGDCSQQGEVFERHEPSDANGHVSRAHTAEAETVARALRAAREAQSLWGRTPYVERCAHMRAVAQALAERQIEIASVVSLETGKTRIESIAEAQEAIDLI
ncbi:MAG: aldehyde dehydrogenase family protein, partial [Solirubrobacteraceae bacterium]